MQSALMVNVDPHPVVDEDQMRFGLASPEVCHVDKTII